MKPPGTQDLDELIEYCPSYVIDRRGKTSPEDMHPKVIDASTQQEISASCLCLSIFLWVFIHFPSGIEILHEKCFCVRIPVQTGQTTLSCFVICAKRNPEVGEWMCHEQRRNDKQRIRKSLKLGSPCWPFFRDDNAADGVARGAIKQSDMKSLARLGTNAGRNTMFRKEPGFCWRAPQEHLNTKKHKRENFKLQVSHRSCGLKYRVCFTFRTVVSESGTVHNCQVRFHSSLPRTEETCVTFSRQPFSSANIMQRKLFTIMAHFSSYHGHVITLNVLFWSTTWRGFYPKRQMPEKTQWWRRKPWLWSCLLQSNNSLWGSTCICVLPEQKQPAWKKFSRVSKKFLQLHRSLDCRHLNTQANTKFSCFFWIDACRAMTQRCRDTPWNTRSCLRLSSSKTNLCITFVWHLLHHTSANMRTGNCGWKNMHKGRKLLSKQWLHKFRTFIYHQLYSQSSQVPGIEQFYPFTNCHWAQNGSTTAKSGLGKLSAACPVLVVSWSLKDDTVSN